MIELVFGMALLVSYVLLFYNYHLTGRKALIYYALAWFSYSVQFFVPRESVYAVSLAMSAALIWLGNIRALEEMLFELPYLRELKYFSAVPLLVLMFLFPEHTLQFFVLVAVSLSLSALLLLWTRNRDFMVMGSLELAFAFVAFFRGYNFSSQHWAFLTALLAVFLAYVSIKVFLDGSFIGTFEVADTKLELESGILMMPSIPDEAIQGALVFSREKRDAPNWFWLTKLSGERTVSPTNLPKILDTAVKFMKNSAQEGRKAVIVLDGIEYLILENGFESVLKFLTTLRDYALMHNATVIIVGEDSFLNERERFILRKLLD